MAIVAAPVTVAMGGLRYGRRSGRKNSLTSLASASGCSSAAKWPPRGMTLHRNRPRPVHARVIGPERRADRTGEPAKADIREKKVAGKRALDIPGAVRPGAHMADYMKSTPEGDPYLDFSALTNENLRLADDTLVDDASEFGPK